MPPETKTQNFSTDAQFSDKTLKKKKGKKQWVTGL